MTLTSEDLQAISALLDEKLDQKLQPIKEDIQELKEDVQELKEDVRVLKDEVKVLKEDVRVLKEDVRVLKEDVRVLKDEVKVLKEDVRVLKDEVQELKGDMKDAKHRITNIELHLENKTDNNIQILADNHLTLIDKLNQSIKVADKSAVYEVKVNYLTLQVEQLAEEVANLKNKIA
ncbi:MAG: hypothetical protein IJ801_07465 [Lachnospiraceae bacterium]|nr:hypothetical protein [Lachnospiraceae bacterium]